MKMFLLILTIVFGIASIISFIYGLIKSNKMLISSIFLMIGTILIGTGRHIIEQSHKGGSSLIYIGLTLVVISIYLLYQIYESYKEKKNSKLKRKKR